jgi:hypothetical protein
VERPLYVEVPIAEIPKWLDHFVSLAIEDELRHLTMSNSVTQTYSTVIDLPHLWILAVERKSARSLDFKPEMGFFCGLHSALMAMAFE